MRVILALALAPLLSIPAVAEDSLEPDRPAMGTDIDLSYEASRMRLEANGYRDVKTVNGNPLRLSAYDREGSEVLLRMNPQDGEVWSSEYVHVMDK